MADTYIHSYVYPLDAYVYIRTYYIISSEGISHTDYICMHNMQLINIGNSFLAVEP